MLRSGIVVLLTASTALAPDVTLLHELHTVSRIEVSATACGLWLDVVAEYQNGMSWGRWLECQGWVECYDGPDDWGLAYRTYAEPGGCLLASHGCLVHHQCAQVSSPRAWPLIADAMK